MSGPLAKQAVIAVVGAGAMALVLPRLQQPTFL